MTNPTHAHPPQDDRLEALQNVVDRVGSYQDGAPGGTVAQELRAGFDDAGVSVSDDEVTRLAGAVEDADGRVDVADVLAAQD